MKSALKKPDFYDVQSDLSSERGESASGFMPKRPSGSLTASLMSRGAQNGRAVGRVQERLNSHNERVAPVGRRVAAGVRVTLVIPDSHGHQANYTDGADQIKMVDADSADSVEINNGRGTVEINNVRGALESININGKNEFTIYPVIGASEIICQFDDTMLATVQQALGRYVDIYGELHTKENEYFPYFAKVQELTILPLEQDIPKLSEMGGMFKDAYDGKTIAEHLKETRDGWR